MDLELHGVRVERDHRVVLDITSLRIRGGRTTAILGPNGSGKTTLLRLIAGLERSAGGSVRLGEPGREAGPSANRPNVAYVFQERVFLRESVRENLDLGLRLRGVEREQRRVRIDEAARLLGVAHLLDRRADRLSGGEGRRVSLARALCLRAPLVLLDEPLEGLDERTYVRLLDELPQLLAAFNATTLLVTHSRDEALRLAQDLVVLVDGRVHAAGEKREVTSNPRVAHVAEVLGYSVLERRRLAIPPGALVPGPGRFEFSMTVDDVVDLVEVREVVGHVEGARVRVGLAPGAAAPGRGDQLLVHADRVCELT